MSFFGITKNGTGKQVYEHMLDYKDRGDPTKSMPFEVLGNPPARNKWARPTNPVEDESRMKNTQLGEGIRQEMLRQKMRHYAESARSRDELIELRRLYDVAPADEKPEIERLIADYEANPAFAQGALMEAGRHRYLQTQKALDCAAQEDFRNWLISHGRPSDHTTYSPYAANGKVEDPSMLWKVRPLSHHPSVLSYIDKQVDARSRFEASLAKLKLRYESSGSLENATLDECWLYFKFIVRGMEPTEEDIKRFVDEDGAEPSASFYFVDETPPSAQPTPKTSNLSSGQQTPVRFVEQVTAALAPRSRRRPTHRRYSTRFFEGESVVDSASTTSPDASDALDLAAASAKQPDPGDITAPPVALPETPVSSAAAAAGAVVVDEPTTKSSAPRQVAPPVEYSREIFEDDKRHDAWVKDAKEKLKNKSGPELDAEVGALSTALTNFDQAKKDLEEQLNAIPARGRDHQQKRVRIQGGLRLLDRRIISFKRLLVMAELRAKEQSGAAQQSGK